MTDYPGLIEDEEQLEELLSRPGDRLTEMIGRLEGDIIFLGITGKIGPSLAMKASRACRKAGVTKRIMGISRSIDPELQKKLENSGIETIRGDLLDPEFLKRLPSFKNVFFLAGMKFGSVENLPLTWAVNSYVPALTADHFKGSRIVAFSTGCVYPLVSPRSGGSLETDQPVATGEYAQSCLGRERMFEYGSKRYGTSTALIRLNYSVEMRYGVLVDIAMKIKDEIPIDLTMGHFNIIWQGDMNDFVLRSMEFAGNPSRILNVTGPDILSVREVASEFGKLLGRKPRFTGTEAPTSLLSNAGQAFSLFGMPEVPVEMIMKWTAHWVGNGMKTYGKPTHFEIRDGKY